MLAVINAGQVPGTPELMEDEAFAEMCIETHNKSAWHWSVVWRVGSRWQIGSKIYIKLENAEDDPFNHYTPPGPDGPPTGPPWGVRPPSNCEGEECGNGCKKC